MHDYPDPASVHDLVQASPRRVRGELGGVTVFDTRAARYVWETVKYPQYYVPLDDVSPGTLVDDDHLQHLRRGTARLHTVTAGGQSRPGAARVYGDDARDGLAGTVRFDWDALDAWYEEDEEVFVHPRNPYVRVDALRSRAHVQVRHGDLLLAESNSCVLVFETGLPTRYYLDRADVRADHLIPTDTLTACPYKGRTSQYWSVRAGDDVLEDAAWTYTFPTTALAPISGLIAFYNDLVEITVDGVVATRTDDLSRLRGTE
ncbi:DUF427 domain-containing protein [uncultured Jatrophihabitans sp.]|uniref:DUF427 domain-containing protein n=1 Tax=uncultured Jatrophihabitans sp. TaxID=1610747 RepID=UPI0035C9F2A5